jgi:glutamate formiminotransferase
MDGKPDPDLLECVLNVSEGRRGPDLDRFGSAARDVLLDVHRDGDHHRSVFTLGGPAPAVEAAARRLAVAAATVDLTRHGGAHPRLGAIDVVPWIALGAEGGRVRDGSEPAAVAARDRFAAWIVAELHVPVFLYGPVDGQVRTLPEVRRRAWHDLLPDLGPAEPHPTLGAACVGARPVLVAYNLWLETADVATAKAVAAAIRTPQLRTLGLGVGSRAQVSCNLVDPWAVGPAAAYDAVAALAPIGRAELVGLLPHGVLDAVPAARWAELDIGPEKTIEARLRATGLDGGRFL